MPELPEVADAAKRLHRAATGETVASVKGDAIVIHFRMNGDREIGSA